MVLYCSDPIRRKFLLHLPIIEETLFNLFVYVGYFQPNITAGLTRIPMAILWGYRKLGVLLPLSNSCVAPVITQANCNILLLILNFISKKVRCQQKFCLISRIVYFEQKLYTSLSILPLLYKSHTFYLLVPTWF